MVGHFSYLNRQTEIHNKKGLNQQNHTWKIFAKNLKVIVILYNLEKAPVRRSFKLGG